MTHKIVVTILICFVLLGCCISGYEKHHTREDLELIQSWHGIIEAWYSSLTCFRAIPSAPRHIVDDVSRFEANYPNHQLIKIGITDWIKNWDRLYWALEFYEGVPNEIISYLGFSSLQDIQKKYDLKDKESASEKAIGLFYTKAVEIGQIAVKNEEDILAYETGIFLLTIGEQDKSQRVKLRTKLLQKLSHIDDEDFINLIADFAETLRYRPNAVKSKLYEKEELGIREWKLQLIKGLVFLEGKDNKFRGFGLEILTTLTNQSFGFDPESSEGERKKSIKKWKSWFQKNKDYLYWVKDKNRRPTSGYFVIDEEAKSENIPINPRTRKPLTPEEIREWREEEKEIEQIRQELEKAFKQQQE